VNRRVFGFVLVATLPLTATAQRAEQIGPKQGGQGRRGGQVTPARAKLEQELRQKVAEKAKAALNLSDDQFEKLKQVDAKYEEQQTALDVRETRTRRALRQSLTAASSADQERRTGDLFDQLLQVQSQRVDLMKAEQKDLSGFLSNSQRARYQALRETMRRQIQDAIAQNAGRGPKPPGP
jgi:coenzyme F420-reducing hydrogenase alpha subunit